MGKFDGVLLISDFDDTLANTKREISRENVAALGYFIWAGGRFTVATGRAKRAFTPHLHRAPINAPVILANGSLLWDYDADRALAEFPVPPEAARDLSEMARVFPQVGVAVYHGEELYIQNPNAHTGWYEQRLGVDGIERALMGMPQPWSKAVMLAPRPDLELVQTFLTERWGDRYEIIFSGETLLECTAKGATKGSMALRLAGLLGVKRENLYCVGDNQNDLSMLAVSAIPFAPENCADSVKETGPYLVRHCDEHAIAHIVEILDSRY